MSGQAASADSPEILARIKEGQEVVGLLARQLRRTFGSHVTIDDLTSHGSEALLIAARTFDPQRGIPFRRWANLRVRGAMVDGIRSQGNLPRRVYRKVRAMQLAAEAAEGSIEDAPPPTAEAADDALSQKLSASALAMAIGFMTMRRGDAALSEARDETESPEEQVAAAELLENVREAIAERPEAERTLLLRHYFDDVTLDEAAKEMGLSRSWASRLHTRALEGIVKAMRRGKIET